METSHPVFGLAYQLFTVSLSLSLWFCLSISGSCHGDSDADSREQPGCHLGSVSVCLCKKTRLCSFQRENYVIFSLKTESERVSTSGFFLNLLLIIIKQVATVELIQSFVASRSGLCYLWFQVAFDHVDIYIYIYI